MGPGSASFQEVYVRRVLRWIGYALGAVAVVAVIAAVIIVVISNREIDARVAVVPPAPVLGHGSAERGKHIFNSISSCVVCHRNDGGGGPFINDPAMAVLNAPNLTRGPGGVGALYTDADYDRAIRRGIRADGTRLLVMPSWAYAAMTDDDAASVVAYIRSMPPVDRTTPRVRLGPIGHVLNATHKLTFDATRIADEGPPQLPPAAPMNLPAYGRYLVRIGGCTSCHGVHLSGGHLLGSPSDPPASNLTPTGIGNWSSANFIITLTKGVDPSHHKLDEFMPWRTIRTMTDDELGAIYEYLKTVPPRADGTG
jgi:mono/diheme cytochrome c family protein